MNKLFILFGIALACCNSVYAQQSPANKTDTLTAALLLRVANHTLTRSDTAVLKEQSGKFLVLNNSQVINAELLLKLATHTLSKAEEESLRKQILQTLKIDTVLIKFNRQGLSEENQKADAIDLRITSCDFEKEANAMILYDLGQMSADMGGIRVTRHKRIKIFTEQGKSAANIRIDYTNQFGAEQIEEIEGRTINFTNGKIEYTELDPKLIYHQNTDKYHESVLFSMPNVKAGSVVEIAYVWRRVASSNVPGWNFQSEIPTGYSQYVMQLYPDVHFSSLDRTTLPLSKDSVIFKGFGHVWAMADVPSIKVEPFMRSPVDGLQSIKITLTSAISPQGQIIDVAESWATIGKKLASDKELSKTFDQKVNDKEGLLKWARMLPTADAKINYLFNQVKTLMRWNGERTWASKDGIKKAWENKSGNWGEINMVLCRLLNEADVKAYPMLASTRDNGIMYRNFPDIYQINKLVAYVPADNNRFYVLDASGKFNHRDEVPFDLLNSYGLYLDKADDKYNLVLLQNNLPVKQQVSINAEIKADGTMAGTAEINSFSYFKTNTLEIHEHIDENKYMQLLTDNDNNLQILSLKLQNAAVDSLPLTQTINFKLGLPANDDKYIYFNPNIFSGLHDNPFMGDNRYSNMDFGCDYAYSAEGRYKIPDGYKVDVLPKQQDIMMPDNSISFKREVLAQDGYITVHYSVAYGKFFFPRIAYLEMSDFYKKMYQMLNEQIVLKKI